MIMPAWPTCAADWIPDCRPFQTCEEAAEARAQCGREKDVMACDRKVSRAEAWKAAQRYMASPLYQSMSVDNARRLAARHACDYLGSGDEKAACAIEIAERLSEEAPPEPYRPPPQVPAKKLPLAQQSPSWSNAEIARLKQEVDDLSKQLAIAKATSGVAPILGGADPLSDEKDERIRELEEENQNLRARRESGVDCDVP